MTPLWFAKLHASRSPKARHRRTSTNSQKRRFHFHPRLEMLENRNLLASSGVNVSISSPLPFPEGDSGTSSMVFLLSRTGDESRLRGQLPNG